MKRREKCLGKIPHHYKTPPNFQYRTYKTKWPWWRHKADKKSSWRVRENSRRMRLRWVSFKPSTSLAPAAKNKNNHNWKNIKPNNPKISTLTLTKSSTGKRWLSLKPTNASTLSTQMQRLTAPRKISPTLPIFITSHSLSVTKKAACKTLSSTAKWTSTFTKTPVNSISFQNKRKCRERHNFTRRVLGYRTTM